MRKRQPDRYWVGIYNDFLRNPYLPPEPRAIAFAMLAYWNPRAPHEPVYPSLPALAVDACMDRRTLIRHIPWLASTCLSCKTVRMVDGVCPGCGGTTPWVTKSPGGGRTTTTYHLNFATEVVLGSPRVGRCQVVTAAVTDSTGQQCQDVTAAVTNGPRSSDSTALQDHDNNRKDALTRSKELDPSNQIQEPDPRKGVRGRETAVPKTPSPEPSEARAPKAAEPAGWSAGAAAGSSEFALPSAPVPGRPPVVEVPQVAAAPGPSSKVKKAKKKRALEVEGDGWLSLIPLYHELLPELPVVAGVGGQPGQTLARYGEARWKEHPDLDFWRTFFGRVRRMGWLMGRRTGRDGAFKASLNWLLRPENFGKVCDGFYSLDPEDGAAPAPNALGRKTVTGHQPVQATAAVVAATQGAGPPSSVVAGWRMEFVRGGGEVGSAEEVEFMRSKRAEWGGQHGPQALA